MSDIVDLTEFGLTGVCIDAKNIAVVYDIQKSHEAFPRVYIHIAYTDAVLITQPFSSKSSAKDAMHHLKKLRDASKVVHLKSVK